MVEYCCPVCFFKTPRIYNHRRHVLKCMGKKVKPKSLLHCFSCQKTTNAVFDHTCLNCAGGFIKCKYCICVFAKNEEVRRAHKCQKFLGRGVNSAFDGKILSHKISDDKNFHSDVFMFFGAKKDTIMKHMKERLVLLKGLKSYLVIYLDFVKFLEDGEIKKISQYLRTKPRILINENDIDPALCEMYQDLNEKIQIFCREGSGWLIDKVNFLTVDTLQYTPMTGGAYNTLPLKLAKSKSLLNIENMGDDSCFQLCLTAALYPAKANKKRVSAYRANINKIKMHGVSTPVSLKDIPKVEHMNNIGINVFEYEDKIYPVYISKNSHTSVVNLLLYKEHYYLITKIDSFLTSMLSKKLNHTLSFFCLKCLNKFSSQALRDKHKVLCDTHKTQILKMPKEKVLKFKDWQKSLFMPVVIYYDTEAYLRPMHGDHATHKHDINSWAMLVVWRYKDIKPKLIYYRGSNAVDEFMKALDREYQIIHKILSEVKEMNITKSEREKLLQEKVCGICSVPFTEEDIKVIDHCHLTAQPRFAAHQSCNMKFSFKKKDDNYEIALLAHCGSAYDVHHLIAHLHNNSDRKISCIPHTSEKYMAFYIDNFKFLDSFHFLSSSLSELSKTLKKEQCGMMKDIFGEHFEMLLEKSIYPYTYASEELMSATELPPKSMFFNDLTEENITDEEYARAKLIWDKMEIKTFAEWHRLYLTSDVVILATLMERFRSICKSTMKLDPLHYVSLPGLSWDAMLSTNNIEIELIQDVDQFQTIESAIRGGVSGIYNKYLKANNRYLPETYDSDKDTSYILYLDAVNLYAVGLSSLLPQGGFRTLSDEEIKYFNIQKMSESGHKGYFMCVDLEIPPELHDLFNLYPPISSKENISETALSPVTRGIITNLGFKHLHGTRLLQTLHKKERYTCHFAILKYFLYLGIKMTKIHSIIEFHQSAYIKNYVNLQTEMRKIATDPIETNLRKSLINQIYGRSIMNVRKHKSLIFVTNEKDLSKHAAKANFVSADIFHEDLVAVSLNKQEVELCQPIAIGAAVLDLTKLHMLKFFYDYLIPKYGFQNIKVGMSDTDSFLIWVKTERDIYHDMKQDGKAYFDQSNYPKHSDMFNAINFKVPGYMKDELSQYYPELIPSEFVGLCSKNYSLQLGRGINQKNRDEKQRMACKGVKKIIARRHFNHALFKSCLLNDQVVRATTKHIRSRKHQLYTVTEEKVALSSLDLKRYILSDKVSSLAFGHWRIKKKNGEKKT